MSDILTTASDVSAQPNRKRGKSRKQGRPRGSVYFHGRTWWMRYIDDRAEQGQRVRVNTGLRVPGEEGKTQAKDMLKKKLAEVDLGLAPTGAGRVRFEALMGLVRTHYVNVGNRSLDRTEYSIARLAQRFAGVPVQQITAMALDSYVAARLSSGVKRGTVKIELAPLHLGFRLAVKKKMLTVVDVPDFPSIKAGAPREGFFERPDFERVLTYLPDYLQPLALFSYYTGWRKGDCLGLAWKAIDTAVSVIRIEKTKNSKARTLPYGKHPALAELISGREKARRDLLRDTGKLSPWVFWRRNGEPIRDFYTAWRTACSEAGVPGRLFHDFRRTAVRNMERACVSRSVGMQITGHKTESIYSHYAITNEADIAEGLGRAAAIEPVQFGPNLGPNGVSASHEGSGQQAQVVEKQG